MTYYHCSDREHPVGLRLSGSGMRGEASRWSEAKGFVATKVYVFEGSGDPMELLASTACHGASSFLYEVEPDGELTPDHHPGSVWRPASCEAAVVKACIHRPDPSVT